MLSSIVKAERMLRVQPRPGCPIWPTLMTRTPTSVLELLQTLHCVRERGAVSTRVSMPEIEKPQLPLTGRFSVNSWLRSDECHIVLSLKIIQLPSSSFAISRHAKI